LNYLVRSKQNQRSDPLVLRYLGKVPIIHLNYLFALNQSPERSRSSPFTQIQAQIKTSIQLKVQRETLLRLTNYLHR